MNKGKFLAVSMALSVALASGSAFADGDAAKGEKVFNKCKSCHTVEAGKHRVGPSLHAIVGRKAGTVEGYGKYKGLQGADFSWTEENLEKWLEDPKKFLGKATSMSLKLAKESERKDVIAYLKTK